MDSSVDRPQESPARASIEELRALAALRLRLREALHDVAPTLIWFAKQQALGGMPANIWKNLDRLPSPRMTGLSPAFDLLHTMQRLERTLRQYDSTRSKQVLDALTSLVGTLKQEIGGQPPEADGAAVDARRKPQHECPPDRALMRLLTDDRTGTMTLESAARLLRCGAFPIRIPAFPSYVAGHVIFSELRLIRSEFEAFGMSTTVKRAPSAAFVAQGVAAVRSFINMVRSRAETCAAIARDLKQIDDLRAVEKNATNSTPDRDLDRALRAQERFLFARLAGNFRDAGVSILGLRKSVFEQAATKADEAVQQLASVPPKSNEWSGPAKPYDLRGLIKLGALELATESAHLAGKERAMRFVADYKRLLATVVDAAASPDPSTAAQALGQLARLHGAAEESWAPSIVHTARYAILNSRVKDVRSDSTTALFSFQPDNVTSAHSDALSNALAASWRMHQEAFNDSTGTEIDSWLGIRFAVFEVAKKLGRHLRDEGATVEQIAEAFLGAADSYLELSARIERKLEGETRWVPLFAERLLFDTIASSSNRSDPLDLLSVLWICDRMGYSWSETRENQAALAVASLQHPDGSFEPGRPPTKWVHGFVISAPSAATIGILASFLAEVPREGPAGESTSAAYERRLARWEPMCVRAIEFLLGSRVGQFKDGRELAGWHSDRQLEDGRIDLFTTCVAVRALSDMHDLVSKFMNRRAFAGLHVRRPKPKAPETLFAFDCRSHQSDEDELPVLLSAQRASEWLRYRTKGFARDGHTPPDYSPRTTLYYGPPGTGKTFTSEIIAGELSWPLVTVNPYDFLREGEQFVGTVAAEIFERLQYATNCCVIFDEFDQLIVDRNIQTLPSPFAMVTTTMLPLLANLHDRAVENNCLIAFATNYYAMLDAAAIRRGRIDQKSCVVYPDYGSRYLFVLRERKRLADDRGRHSVDTTRCVPAATPQTIAKATAMRAVSDLVRVAGNLDASPDDALWPAAALGPGHYLDMQSKIKEMKRSTSQTPNAADEKMARSSREMREVARFVRSLRSETDTSRFDPSQFALATADRTDWQRLVDANDDVSKGSSP